MLPIGTPPNAIMFGMGKIKFTNMAGIGVCINIFATLIIVLAVYYLLPIALGIDLNGSQKFHTM
ncbi:anion permease [Paenibacillaceae sp. P-4]|uniref:anion permease n=1 Tax=Paenibacillaceae bacterium P-4 TaxID=3160969 RepID=UPI0032E805F7